MSQLGTFFLILTPFGFFCTENGTGLITGAVFLILGLLFKWLGNGGTEKIQNANSNVPKVSSEEFWKIHFCKRYNELKDMRDYSEPLDYVNVKEAKNWADDVTKANGGIPPTDNRFEQIAKEMGLKTEGVANNEVARKSLIAIAERCLMQQLIEEYEKQEDFKKYLPKLRKFRDTRFFKHPTTKKNIVGYYDIEKLKQLYVTIPESEKAQARKNVEEYERKVVKFPIILNQNTKIKKEYDYECTKY